MFDRKKQLRWASLKVGIVITVTLLIIFFVIMFSGGIESLFRERVSFNIYISDVRGLRSGAPVMVAGFDVGEVKKITLSREHGIVVKVLVNKDVIPYLKADAKARIQSLGLLGDKYVEISPGEAQQSFDPSKGMYGEPQTEIKDIVATVSSTLSNVEKFIKKLDKFIAKIDESQGTFSKLLSDPALYNNLNSAVAELKETLKEIRYGSLGMLARDKDFYERLSNSLKNFENASNKIASSEGSLGKLINEPTLYENLLSSSQKLDAILKEIETSEGTLALLIKDKNTAEDLRQSIREIKELIEEIKKNPKKFFKFSVF
ncbi:MlaD family protein [Thermodesulfovibrio hydrogeniphilus]